MSASSFALLVSHRGSVASTFDSASICLGSTIGVALAVLAFDTMRLPLIFDAPFAGAPYAPRFLVMVFALDFMASFFVMNWRGVRAPHSLLHFWSEASQFDAMVGDCGSSLGRIRAGPNGNRRWPFL